MHTPNSSCNTQKYQGRSSTYLKAAQDLLDEFVNVHTQMEMVKNDDDGLDLDRDLSPSHLQNKHAKLFCMLDEVIILD